MFKAIYRDGGAWKLSEHYFFSEEEVKDFLGTIYKYKWPVEVWENGSIYVPSEEELKE